MAKITYEDKEFLNKNESIADKNKVNDTDLNQIKEVVNGNDDKIGNLSDLNTADKSNLVEAINEKKINKLWENPNTNNTFSPQSITLSSDDYDYLIWLFDYKKGLNKSISAFSIKGQGVFANAAGYWEPGGATYAATIRRDITYVNDKKINVDNCYARYGNNTSNNPANDWLIPIAVYGGKF